jgi:hypothetical protein
MKKILFILLLAVGISGVSSNRCSAKLSTGQKVALGCGLAGVGAIGLLYYYAELKNKKDKNFFENIEPFASGAAVLGGAVLAGKAGYDHYYDGDDLDDLIPGVPSTENIMLKNGNIGFCETVMGISEKDFKKLSPDEKKELFEELEKNGVSAGKFETYSVGKLQKLCEKRKRFGVESTIRFIVNPTVDVKDLQADPAYNGAAFQVASNFNCLEAGQGQGDKSDSNGLQNVRAQGEQAVVSANIAAYQLRKHRLGRINLLDELETGNFLVMKPGNSQPAYFCKKILNVALNDIFNSIQIGFHRGISVTHGKNFKNIISKGKGQKINHVLCSALDMRGHLKIGVMKSDKKSTFSKNMSMCVLRAAYTGTILSTYINDIKHVVLTLLGGGVFGNDMKIIAKELDDSLGLAKKLNMDVTVVCRMRKLPQSLQDVANKYKK